MDNGYWLMGRNNLTAEGAESLGSVHFETTKGTKGTEVDLSWQRPGAVLSHGLENVPGDDGNSPFKCPGKAGVGGSSDAWSEDDSGPSGLCVLRALRGRSHFLTTEDTESTEKLPEFLLVWSSGHEPPVSVYYQKTERGWNGTFDREQATRFKTRRAALNQWRRLHAFPDNYEHCIHDGSVRAERYQALELNF